MMRIARTGPGFRKFARITAGSTRIAHDRASKTLYFRLESVFPCAIQELPAVEASLAEYVMRGEVAA